MYSVHTKTNQQTLVKQSLKTNYKLKNFKTMGKIENLNGMSFSGEYGNLIIYTVRGKTYYRRKPASVRFPNTEEQEKHLTHFNACVQLAKSAMDDINKQIWNKRSKEMAGFQLFIKKNYPFFDEEGKITEYSNLQFTMGMLALPKELNFENSETGNGEITLKWKTIGEYGSKTDRLRVIAICGDELTIIQELTATRIDQNATFKLPLRNGNIVHLYAYFVDLENMKCTGNYYQMLQIPNS